MYMLNYRNQYERMRKDVSGKKIKGFGISTYCKITEQFQNDPIHYMCDFSFGTGIKKFCLVANYMIKRPDEIYIDRVENNKACLIGKDITEIANGSVNLVRLALYEMYQRFPNITRFTLKDDSHLYCNGLDHGDRILLAYETLLKYNQTWYQQKFGAVLPGFISSTTDETQVHPVQPGTIQLVVPIHDVPTIFVVQQDSSMFYYLQSLANLDLPLIPYPSAVDNISDLAAFQAEYESARTPREFMKNVRARFVLPNGRFDKKAYCYAVVRWFSRYMNSLRINLYKESWYIPVSTIVRPDDFSEEPLSKVNAMRHLDGGSRRQRTRSKRNKDQWGIIPYESPGSRIGGLEFL